MKWLRPGSASTRVSFVLAAVLVRSLDAGATVGVVLVAVADPTVGGPVRLGAAVGAAITLPHVLGPWVARVLTAIPDPRVGIAVASGWYAALLSAVVLAVGHLGAPLLIVLAALAGFAGPALTGGLSGLATTSLGPGRRSSSWDALTYGLSGTVAPALVATTAALIGPVPGVLTLTGLGLVGGLLVLTLPRPEPTNGGPRQAPVALCSVGRFLLADPRMRVVVVLTWAGAFITSAALIAGLSAMEDLAADRTGVVAAALGLGGLVGAAALVRWPLRHRPEVGLVVTTLALAGCCLGAAVVERSLALVAAFALLGLLNAPHTVFSLAAREELPPPALRRHVFVTLAGTKVAFASLGTATAGLFTGLGSAPVLAGLAALGVLSAVGVRGRSGPRTVEG